ncbi:MAG: acyl dehydratase [Betaproteobacteria bacterium]|nr:acyl dehydratase [Betaproteobacteria bacterium]
MNSTPMVREYDRPPSAKLFMARAMVPKRRPLALPQLELRLAPAPVPARDYADYLALTGLADGALLPLTWPQVWGFRLQMAMLTDRSFPLPIWSALQVRNCLVQHAPLSRDTAYGLCVAPRALRRLEKGVEIDLATRLADAQGQLVWESVTTFYWRGHQHAAPDALSEDAASPPVDGRALAHWASGSGAGWRFGALTGDYNGIHWSDRYARAFGFKRAFHHPPRVVGQCLAHLGVEREAPRQTLELWLKGPVFYRSELDLLAGHEAEARVFGLYVDRDTRPALVGRWSVAPGAGAGSCGAEA